MDKFLALFTAAKTVGEADTIMSLYELEQWFLDNVTEPYDSYKTIENLEKHGIEPQPVGGKYLFLLKSK